MIAEVPGGMTAPDNSKRNLMKTKVLGMLFIPISFAMGYYFIFRPLEEARQTGVLHYYLKGVLFPPVVLYAGIALLVSDLRDGQTRRIDEKGQKKLTRKGWIFVGGLVVVMLLTFAAWSAYLHSVGFSAL